METKAHFTLIAFFTLAVIVAGQSFVNWIVGSRQNEKLKYYQLVFHGSAPGLTAGGGVLFNGLQVGQVTQVGLSSRAPNQVDAVIEVGEKTPVKADTKAHLDRRSPVGSVVVALTGGRSDAPDIRTAPDQFYPVIIVDRPVHENFLERIQSLSALAPRVFEKMGKIVDDSRGAYAALKWDLDPFMKTIADNSEKVNEIVEDVRDFSRSVKPIVEHYNSLVAAVDARTPYGASRAANSDGALASFADSLSASKLKAMEQFAVDARKAARSLDRFARALERDAPGALSDETSARATNKKP